MKKRVLSMFMALALCLTLLPASAWAAETEGGAAQIGDAVYSTLPEAVDAAQDGDTIKLLADYKTAEGAGEEGESGLTITKSVTLDLNGHGMDDFQVAQVNDAGETLPSGNLTVEDTSAAKTGKVTGTIELLAGNLTINGGTIGDGRDGVSIENGNLTVNGGTMDCLYGSNSGTVKIAGGTVKNAQLVGDFEITVTGGSGHTGLWDVSEGKWNISGGEFGEVMFKTASPAENAPISGGTFGKITRQNLQNNTETPAPISGLLADGYAFYEKTDSGEYDGYVNLDDAITSLENVQVKRHTHEVVNGVCTVCKQEMKAQDTTGKYYLNLQDAFAGVADGGTVTMLTDDDRISFCNDTDGNPVEKTVTLMMNGKSLSFEGAQTLYVGSGKLIIGDEATISQTGQMAQPAVFVDNHEQGKDRGTLEFQGKATITGGLLIQNWGKLVGGLKKGTIITSNDAYSVSVERSETYSNVLGLLGDGLAFAKKGNPTELVNGNVKQLTEDVIVVAHKHNIVDGSCACGFTCAQHDWSDKNGVCTVCGYHCPHNAGAAEADGVWACDTCGQTVTAKVTAPDGAITYYADGYVNTNVKSGLYFAIKAAKTGSTVAALGGEYSGGYVTGNKTLTLDVSNGKTIDGILNVGYTNTGDTGDTGDTGNTLIVIGSAEISYVIVEPKNTLDLTGWTGRIGSLTVQNGGKATLNGGTFATLYINGATAGSLLAEGYAFQNAGTGAYVEYSSTAIMENVKVVKCPHSGVTLKEDHSGVACKYCGANFAATLDDAPYGKIDEAVADWLENGGTLKLYADYTATDGTWRIGSGLHTVNLNGHMMSVEGDGNAFKPTNNMHLTVTDGTERGQITNILLDGSQNGSFTLENGFVGNLKMTGGAVVTLKGGSVDNLDVQDCSVNTNLSIQGGSIGKLNIKDWAEGMHVSGTDGSLGAYTLPSGKILADVLDHQYYAEGTSLDKSVDTAQSGEKFVIKQAPYDFGSASKAAAVPLGGEIPFRVDSPSENVGVYDVKWYRRTNSGAEHMTENRVADVKVGDRLDVFCVITGLDQPNNGTVLWQVAVKDYTINVAPADLSQEAVVFKQVADEFGFMGNIGDGKGTFVFTPFGGNADSPTKLSYLFEVSCNGRKLTEGSDYIITGGNTAKWAGTYTLTIEGRGNYTGTATHTWRIEPYKLTRGNYRPPTITKVYDGTTGFDFSKAGNWGIFTENVAHRPNDEKTGNNPVLGADGNAISIYLKPEDLKASAVTLDSPDVGDRTASYTIMLKARDGQREPNFAFEDGGSPTIQVTGAAASITKAPAPTGLANGALTVYNGTAKTYEIDIASLLPSPGAGCRYGEIYDSQTIGFETYKTEITEIKLDSSYYDKTADKAKIEKGKLILPIRNVNTTTTGKIGTIKLNVISQNYHQIKDWTIDVSAANQPVSTGGSSSGSTVKTGTVTNPDGSVTKTETKSDGTVVETTTGKDGSTTKTETKKDGSSVTESKDAAGSTGTVKTDKNGNTEAETKVSAKAVEDAKKSGEAVKAPVQVEATRNSDTAPTVKIELPKNSGDTKVEIPVTNVKPGTVAVLVHPDGTEEIVKDSIPTENGVQLTVNGGATVKIVDNSKDFIDTRNHWAKDAIDFVSARGLVNGMNDSIYAPNNSTTRAQLWTILARQNDADLNGGNTWYEKAQLWSKNKGISDGTEPNAAINRAQMVTMLWRAAGSPAAQSGTAFQDVAAGSYYGDAVAWAVENGITAGVGNGRFDPNSTCTRGQIATFLYRTYQGK